MMESRMEKSRENIGQLERIVCKDRGHFWIGALIGPKHEETFCKDSGDIERALRCEKCMAVSCQRCHILHIAFGDRAFGTSSEKSISLGIHDKIAIWRN